MQRPDDGCGELYAWLAKESPEPVLEPELEIVDPHHHLWDRRPHITPSFPYRQRLYRLEELLEDIETGGHNVVATVYVQAGSFHRRDGPAVARPVGEVEYCQGVAAAADSGAYKNAHGAVPRLCLGIQGTLDLRHPDVESALLEMLRCRNFRGVRAKGPYDEAFRRGFRLLERHGLVFDRWHHPYNGPSDCIEEIFKLAALAREFPTVSIVLDHLGGAVGPLLSQEDTTRWRQAIEELAQCGNVVCKVGGIQMAINGWAFEKRERPIGSEELCELTLPWYEHVIRSFGASRCMFESNFPVDKDCVSYRTLWNSFKRTAQRLELSDAEKREIFSGTAKRVYRLAEPGQYSGPQAAL